MAQNYSSLPPNGLRALKKVSHFTISSEEN